MKNAFVILTLLILGCSEDNPPQQVNLDANIDFYVLDNEGNDLLDMASINAINLDQIRVYYMVNGEKKEVFSSTLDSPRGFTVLPPDGQYEEFRIRLELNIEDKSNSTITLFQWDSNTTDTFLSEFSRGDTDGFVICTKVTYNNSVVFDVAFSQGDRFFEIKK